MQCISPDGNVYQAGTLSGNPVAMAAGIAQLSECLKAGFYTELENKTKKLTDGIVAAYKHSTIPFKIFNLGSIFWIAFTTKEKIQSAEEIDGESMKYFRQLHASLLEQGIYLGPSGYEVGFMGEAHTDEDIQKTINAFAKAFEILN